MNDAKKRRIATIGGDGIIRFEEQDTPPVKHGTILVEVHSSLVSPGSEVGGWRGLLSQRNTPNHDRKPKPFGYSNSGIVRQVGVGVNEFKVGDRVCCMGGGYASHTNFAVVPHHLCVHLPREVTFAQGTYGHLAATALHALRRNDPEFGEYAAVVGLGLVGQLTAQIHRLAGCYVIGWDTIDLRLKIARHCGINEVTNSATENASDATHEFTNGKGLDSAVLAFGGDGTKVFNELQRSCKRAPDGLFTGRIVIVGKTTINYNAATANIDIRRTARTGPGYHDKTWESGEDYPTVYMRWTTRTNLELCMRLIAEQKLLVDPLTTHTVPMDQVENEMDRIIRDPDSILGVIIQYRNTSRGVT